MKLKAFSFALLLLMIVAVAGSAVQQPSFSGNWVMDQDRSFGLPPNVKQAIKVTQTGDQIDVETRVINPDGEYTIKDSYIIDGKERDFVPQGPKGPIPNSKGKRTGSWLPNGRGVMVDEETTTETPKGVVNGKLTRRWTISGEGELLIVMFVDTSTISYETKRIFKKL